VLHYDKVKFTRRIAWQRNDKAEHRNKEEHGVLVQGLEIMMKDDQCNASSVEYKEN